MTDVPAPLSPGGNQNDREFFRALCMALAAEIDPVVDRTVDRIMAELPEYSSLDHDRYQEDICQQLLEMLEWLGRGSPPHPVLDRARTRGSQRAEQGIPAESMLRAWHVGFQEAWRALLARVRAEQPAEGVRLLDAVDSIWAQLHAVTGAAVAGHTQTVRARAETRIILEHQFLESLYGGRATAESATLVARALDFDPNGTFQVICSPAGPSGTPDLQRLRQRLRPNAGKSIAVVRGSALVIVFQNMRASQVLRLLGEGDTPVTAGVGLARHSLAGAAESTADAEQALAIARHRGGVTDFSSDWLTSTLLLHKDRLAPLTNTGHPASHPHLRDAVRAYAEHGFSITEGAEALHIHPNTMKYRLNRWHELTGWDPRTLDGLQRSLLSITITDTADPPGLLPGQNDGSSHAGHCLPRGTPARR